MTKIIVRLYLSSFGGCTGLEKGRWVDRYASDLLGFLSFLGKKHSLDVGQDTTLGNGDTGQ